MRLPVTEAWLAGAVADVAPELQPVAHALLHARADVERALGGTTAAELDARPGAGAPASYHLRHLAGSLDRLLTYARGEMLTDTQFEALAAEKRQSRPADAAELRALVLGAIDRALDQIRGTAVSTLGESREVGRARTPSTVRGLLFHAAEHSARHAGQAMTAVLAARRPVPPRHTMRGLLGGAVKRLLDLERGILLTARYLTVAPERVIRGYIGGERDRYTNPIGYLLVTFAVFALVAELLDLTVTGGGSDNRYLTALVVPFVALSSRIVFWRAGLNLAEHLIIVTYAFGHLALLMTAVEILIPMLGMGILRALLLSALAATIVYVAWVYGRVFGTRPWLGALGGFVALLVGVISWAAALVGLVALAQR